ncbi:MAG: V-type ATP synthase subunit A [Candidatus Natronoplasma sp.]
MVNEAEESISKIKEPDEDEGVGRIIHVAGPVVEAEGLRGVEMYEVVEVGEEGLIGEVIELDEDVATIQVYEETGGVKPGEPVERTGEPLSLELGPGLIEQIYDGIQRPLEGIVEETGDFIKRGIEVSPLDEEREWEFEPKIEEGEEVEHGDILGIVEETKTVEHRVMVPPDKSGEVKEIVSEGKYTINETIAILENEEGEEEISMKQRWPVRVGRPIKDKKQPGELLVTGQRVLDTFFPLAKGGTAAIPGGFGTGKTVIQHQLAKWSDADIVVYVGCGERGNEMTEVLRDFPELEDPWSGEPLMKRTVLIANTSNMPVAAREASVFSGITIAEYYRDMGYNVALMADSTSRWAEALREISGRLEEMPGEEGFPAYLASELASFYERAGICELYGDREGSVSVIGAVSPSGGDFSEPVTQNTLRIAQVFWALDTELKNRRHFPAIDWLTSYSLYLDQVGKWWDENVNENWQDLRRETMRLLEKESELEEIVQLVGPDALPTSDQFALQAARLVREDFLQQNAFHDVDTFCSPEKQFRMLQIIMEFYETGQRALEEGVSVDSLSEMDVIEDISRMSNIPSDEWEEKSGQVEMKMNEEFKELEESLELSSPLEGETEEELDVEEEESKMNDEDITPEEG